MTTTAARTTTTASPTGIANPATQLKISCALTMGFALMFSLGAHTSTDGLARWFADLIFWPVGDAGVLTDEAQLFAAILGGVMASWAVLFWMLTDALADTNSALLRRLVLVTLGAWFVIDNVGSIAAGAPLNVVGNTGFLAMFVVPALRLPSSSS